MVRELYGVLSCRCVAYMATSVRDGCVEHVMAQAHWGCQGDMRVVVSAVRVQVSERQHLGCTGMHHLSC